MENASEDTRTLRAALYLRVSTVEQNATNQLPALQAYAASRGWTVIGTFADEGVSGRKRSRPEFDRLMNAARAGEFDVLICWKLDRVGRSVLHLHQIVEELRQLKIEFVSTTQSIDTSTAAGKLMFGMLAAFAEFESDLIGERTKIGLLAARANGTKLGRPGLPFDADELARLRAAGTSARACAKLMNIPQTTIRRRIAVAA